MKKILLLFLLSFFVISCDKSEFPNQTLYWKVTHIITRNNSVANYKIEPINSKDLNTSIIWTTDTIGAFQVGDTVKFSKIK